MKRHVWLSLTLTVLVANAWAVPAPEHEPSAEAKMGMQTVHEKVAQDGHAQLIKQYQRV